MPELVAQNRHGFSQTAERVCAVFLYESDEQQILRNFSLREPEEGEPAGRAHVSWLYGEWLKKECEQYGLLAVPATPWDSLLDRIVEAIS